MDCEFIEHQALESEQLWMPAREIVSPTIFAWNNIEGAYKFVPRKFHPENTSVMGFAERDIFLMIVIVQCLFWNSGQSPTECPQRCLVTVAFAECQRSWLNSACGCQE